ncbi:MAG: hypothetical protein ACTSO9_20185, partial [Candidatus Helarchaeota archaeon]
TIAQYANRWVSKLGRDKTYLQNIRDINYLLKDIQNLYSKLYHFLDKKYRRVKNIENLDDLIQRLIDLKENARSLKENELEIKNNLKTKEKELNRLKSQIKNLEQDEIINKLTNLEKNIEKISSNVRNLIGPIRKPLKKFSKIIDNGQFNLRPDSVSYLNSYLNDPINSFLKENEEFVHLKSILLDLKDAIDSNKLKLKTGSEKKIKQKIKQVETKNLYDLKLQYDDLVEKKQNLLLNPKYKEKISILEELKQKEEIFKRELEDINLKLEKNNDDYSRALYKIGDYKTRIEKTVLEVINTQIKLIL